MRLFILTMAFVFGGLIVGCTSSIEPETYSVNNQSVTRVRTDTDWSENLHGEATHIDSLSTLTNYIEENEELFDFTQGNPSFETIVDNYDETFFEHNTLLLIAYEENSGSITHEIDNIQIDNGELIVNVERTKPQAGTTDMAAWHLIVELDRDEYDFESYDVLTQTTEE